MGIPGTVQKVALSFGPYFDHAGRPLEGEAFWIDCAAAPITAADGGVVVKRRVRVITDTTGAASTELVANDAAGLSKTGFTYTVSGPVGVLPEPVEISLPASVPAVDFDKLSPSEASDGATVYLPSDALEPYRSELLAARDEAIAAREGMVVAARLDAGELAFVTIDGTVIPVGNVRGQKGDPGEIGPAGLTWRGTWSATVDYAKNDAVYYGGASWFASGDPAVGEIPSEVSLFWWPMALRGTKGDPGDQGPGGTITDVTATTLATGAPATVTLGGTPTARTIALGLPAGGKGDPGDQTSFAANSTASGATSLTLSNNATRLWTLSGNLTISFTGTPINAAYTITVVLKQAATGGPFTVTWPATLEWAGDALAPTMPTVANAELIVHLFWTGVAWRAMVAGIFFP